MTLTALAIFIVTAGFIQGSRPDTSGPIRRFIVLWVAIPLATLGPFLLLILSTFRPLSDSDLLDVAESVFLIVGAALGYVSQIHP